MEDLESSTSLFLLLSLSSLIIKSSADVSKMDESCPAAASTSFSIVSKPKASNSLASIALSSKSRRARRSTALASSTDEEAFCRSRINSSK